MQKLAYWRDRVRPDWLAMFALIVLVLLISRPGLQSNGIDDLDSAHHLMDGYFFRDLIVDHPLTHLPGYTLAYYKQYPALGFLFWPPLVPFVLGLFDLAGGAHISSARPCLLFFGVVFALAFYRILRKSFPTAIAFAGVCAMVTAPGLAWSFNEVMLEMPTLAVMCLAILAYGNMMAKLGEPGSTRRAVVCGLACAAVVYAKQPAWFLYPALSIDFLLRFRRAAPAKDIWLAFSLTVLLCVPLGWFTVKFGHANLAQSVGSNTRLIMPAYEGVPRWSLAAWMYYPRLAWSSLNPLLVALGVFGLGMCLARRELLRRHALILAWFVLAYLTFSFYDNRTSRHATFWWPAWMALAAVAVDQISMMLPQTWSRLAAVLLLVFVPFQGYRAWHQDYSKFHGERGVMQLVFAGGPPGNVLLLGPDKQVSVALIREFDRNRTVHAVRGDDLLESGESLATMCYRYRIGTVMVELSPGTGLNGGPYAPLLGGDMFQIAGSSTMQRNGVPVTIVVARYHGALAPVMADVSLSKRLL